MISTLNVSLATFAVFSYVIYPVIFLDHLLLYYQYFLLSQMLFKILQFINAFCCVLKLYALLLYYTLIRDCSKYNLCLFVCILGHVLGILEGCLESGADLWIA